ncbi:MAG: cytochrome c3 family protein [Proteobacteria bacterium]|nr:cytochrome c3 family protein [Pseudomonadota bacterium]
MHAVKRQLVMALMGALVLLVSNVCFGTSIPDKITINSIQKYYDGVSFNHAAHINNLKDCGLCHHHTTGAQVSDPNCIRCHKNSGAQAVVSCKGCHAAEPFTPEALKRQKDQFPPIYHMDKVGLKGSYHLGCLGCHKKMGGPTGCQDCHKRNVSGDVIFHSNIYAPKTTAEPKQSHH